MQLGYKTLPTLTNEDKKSPAWRRPTLPGPCGPSTIGAGGLNGRVRDGYAWNPSAIITRPVMRRSRHDPHVYRQQCYTLRCRCALCYKACALKTGCEVKR